MNFVEFLLIFQVRYSIRLFTIWKICFRGRAPKSSKKLIKTCCEANTKPTPNLYKTKTKMLLGIEAYSITSNI